MKELRLISLILVASLVTLSLGMVFSIMRNHVIHMYLMISTMILFPHAVALAYVSSLNRKDSALREAALLLSLPLVIMPLSFNVVKLYSIIPFSIMVIYSLASSRLWKGSPRYSLILVGVSYVYLTISMIMHGGLVTTAIHLLSYLITLIVAVTSHSLPSTFRDEALWPFSFISAFTSSLTFISYKLIFIPLIFYAIGVRLWSLPRYLKIIERYDKRTFAYRGNRYFLMGHAFVLPSVAVSSLACLGGPLTLLHAILLSFVTIHIYIHTPMMLPVILRIRHRRNYMNWIFILPLLSAALWPFVKDLAWLLYASGLYFLTRVMV